MFRVSHLQQSEQLDDIANIQFSFSFYKLVFLFSGINKIIPLNFENM